MKAAPDLAPRPRPILNAFLGFLQFIALFAVALGGPACRGEPGVAAPAPSSAPAAAAPAAQAPPPTTPPPAPARRIEKPRAAPGPGPGIHVTRHSGRVDGAIPYLVVEPADATPDLPIVLAMHGRGDQATAFAAFAEDLRLPARVLVLHAPLPWGRKQGRQWFDMGSPEVDAQIAQRVDDLRALVAQLESTDYPKARGKPLLVGFSQGAMLAIQAVARAPETFGGAAALSGDLRVTAGNKTAPVGHRLPVLLTAGERDTLVVPERTEKAAAALRTLGHAVEVLRFRGGHKIPRDVRSRTRSFLTEHAAAARPAR